MPKADRAAVVPLLVGHCPCCGHALVRAETGWACPRGLDHVRILADEALAEQIQGRLPEVRPPGMSAHQWGWFKSRPAGWAGRIVRELKRRHSSPRMGGGGSKRRQLAEV